MAQGQGARPAIELGTFQVSTRALAVGGGLMAAGAIVGLAGMLVTSAAMLAATRRWIDQMETPPSELARQKLAQARAATQAGTAAWHDGVSASARH
jgi:hypothetical protein